MPSAITDIPPIENEADSIPEILQRFNAQDHEETIKLHGLTLLASVCETPFFLKDEMWPDKTLLIQTYIQPNNSRRDSETMLSSTPVKVKADIFQISPRKSPATDYFGSPLNCKFSSFEDKMEFGISDCIINQKKRSKKSYMFSGLSLHNHWSLISEIQGVVKKVDNPLFGVACAIDGEDPMRTALMGTAFDGTMMDITYSGPYEDHSNFPSISSFRSQFQIGCLTEKIDTFAEATYNVYGDNLETSTCVMVNSSWKRPLTTLAPPPFDATSFVEIDVVPADPEHPAYNMYAELLQLEEFVQGLKTGELCWNSNNATPVVEQLEKIFQNMQSKDTAESNKPESLENIIGSKFYNIRNNMDFTDCIWTALRHSRDMEDLCKNLNFVFDAVSTKEVRPTVHISDSAQIAVICHKLVRNQPVQYNVEKDCLKMIVEIGLKKLKQDYLCIFQIDDLITSDQLRNLVKSRPIEEDIHVVKGLHVILHVIVMLKNYMDLPQATLFHIVSQMLQKISARMPLKFSFQVQTGLLQDTLASLLPCDWTLKMRAIEDDGCCSKSMNVHITNEPIFPNMSSKKEITVEEDAEERTNYYMSITTFLKDTFNLNDNSRSVF